jgi:hypothetical protein
MQVDNLVAFLCTGKQNWALFSTSGIADGLQIVGRSMVLVLWEDCALASKVTSSTSVVAILSWLLIALFQDREAERERQRECGSEGSDGESEGEVGGGRGRGR